ncbi:hypothetical protein ADK55_35425 [Streptomyces sp. WM4235]|uniref:methyltransferase n=1 Tax=Streptomyces sp. WM4235 TaxID=1415551 RepID=UPI0006AE56C0|nr:methyltransferase [Streptomyces sp. WM4235]KOU37881.1 hypothetical protein ADK55_35425 [Streptomyces sp. WM4235]
MSVTEGSAGTAPAEQSLSHMALGFVPARILYTAAELGIPEALGDGPRTHPDLARQTGTDPAALRRLLRALAGLGLVTQLDEERFSLTALGRGLAGAERDDVMLSTAPELWRAWGELTEVVRSGRPALDPVSGLTAHETMLADPQTAAKLRTGMAQVGAVFAPGVVAAYDFSRFSLLADLGGDDGTLTAAVLTAVPALRAVIHEREENLERTSAALAAAGVADRCELTAGSGTPLPPGSDACLLNNLVRDLGDERAGELLRGCRAGLPPTGRLLLVETLMPPVLTPEASAAYGLTDLNNLVFAGGRERTEEEYAQLLAGAGFKLTGTFPVPVPDGMPDYHVIEATPTT